MNGNQESCYLYLLHFDRPYHHARHYLGKAIDWQARVALHQNGQAQVKLTTAAAREGIEMDVAAVWRGTGADESRLKYRYDTERVGGHVRYGARFGLKAICPECGGSGKFPKARGADESTRPIRIA